MSSDAADDVVDDVADSDKMDTIEPSVVDTVNNLWHSKFSQRKREQCTASAFLAKTDICFLTTCSLMLYSVTHTTCPSLITEVEVNSVFDPFPNDPPLCPAVLVEKKE